MAHSFGAQTSILEFAAVSTHEATILGDTGIQSTNNPRPASEVRRTHIVAALSEPLPLPAGPGLQGLTRSQRLFALVTGVNPLSLTVGRGEEFFLFMRLREQHQWRTFSMTSHRYVEATHLYNVGLERLAPVYGLTFVPKNPRALLNKLGEIEGMILKRIYKQDFMCTHFVYC